MTRAEWISLQKMVHRKFEQVESGDKAPSQG